MPFARKTPVNPANALNDSTSPRQQGFERRAWTHAESRGFVKQPGSLSDAVPIEGALGSPVPLQASAPGPAEEQKGPPSAPNDSKSPSLLSKAVLGFFSTFSFVALIIESTALVVSQMTDPLNTSFMALAGIVSLSYGAYAVGSFIGGRWVDKFGIAKSYRTVLAVRTGIWTTVALLFNPVTGTVPLMFMVPLFALDYFVHSMGRIAEHKLQVAWFPDSPVASGRFGTVREFIEWAAVFAAGLSGLAIAKFGFGAVLYPTPFILAFATMLAFSLKSLPQFSAEKTEEIDLNAGRRAVMSSPGILKPLFGLTLINGVFFMLYYIAFTAFGNFVTGDKHLASQVSGSLGSLYAVGATLGTIVMMWISQRIDKKVGAAAEADKKATERSLYAKSGASWLKWAAVGALGSWAFISQAAVGSFIWWPIFPASIAVIGLAFTAQIALVHVDAIMKDRIPEDQKKKLGGSIVGFIRAISYASQIAGFLLCGAIFALLGAQGFIAFAVLCTAIAGAYLWLRGDLLKKP